MNAPAATQHAQRLLLKCGACSKLMATGEAQSGGVVRCPHCRCVVEVPPMASPIPTPEEAVFPSEVTDDQVFPPRQETPPSLPSDEIGSHTLPGIDISPAEVLAENPWTRENLSGTATMPVETTEAVRDARGRGTRLPASVWGLALLVPYSLAITLAALALYLRSPEIAIHPLESLADQSLYEEFNEGRRIVDPRTDLGPIPLLKMGESRRIGDLQVTPLDVARKKLTYRLHRGARDYVDSEESLVLRLRLQNVSRERLPAGLAFHPNDPTFNRALVVDRDGSEIRPYTYLELAGQRFYGPIRDVLSERIDGQSFAELLPGEAMETIIVARHGPGARGSVVEALESLFSSGKADEPLVWRVHLRKGREEVALQNGKKRQVWVTTVAPVSFTPAQVTR